MIYRISRPRILQYKHTVCKNNIVRIIIIWKPSYSPIYYSCLSTPCGDLNLFYKTSLVLLVSKLWVGFVFLLGVLRHKIHISLLKSPSDLASHPSDCETLRVVIISLIFVTSGVSKVHKLYQVLDKC